MSRVKGGLTTRRRKKKVFRRAKGYRLGKKNLYRHAVEQVEKGLQYAYRDRKTKKRRFHSLWIIKINAAARLHGISYSKFIQGLRKANVNVNRKILADLAVQEPEVFASLIETAKSRLS